MKGRIGGLVEKPGETQRRFEAPEYRFRSQLSFAVDNRPKLHYAVSFIAPTCSISGRVELSEYSSVWYNTIIRADTKRVFIGPNSHVLEGTIISEHYEDVSDYNDGSVIIGENVLIGHHCVLKGCTLEDNCMVGDRCVVDLGAHMETRTILAPGSYLGKNERMRESEYWAGSPAKYVRDLTEEETSCFKPQTKAQAELAKEHAREWIFDSTYLAAEDAGVTTGYTKDPSEFK